MTSHHLSVFLRKRFIGCLYELGTNGEMWVFALKNIKELIFSRRFCRTEHTINNLDNKVCNYSMSSF